MTNALDNVCDHEVTPGWLLVSSIVYWSHAPSVSLFPSSVLRPQGIGRYSQYMTRPVHFRGSKCDECRVYRAELSSSCVHEFESGFVFPYAPLLWWPHDQPFRPTFLYPIVRRSKDGGEPEVAFAPKRLIVTISDARCPARKCLRCSGVEIPSRPNA